MTILNQRKTLQNQQVEIKNVMLILIWNFEKSKEDKKKVSDNLSQVE